MSSAKNRLQHGTLGSDQDIQSFFSTHSSFAFPLIRRRERSGLIFQAVKAFLRFCHLKKTKGQDLINEMELFEDLAAIYRKFGSDLVWEGKKASSKKKRRQNKNNKEIRGKRRQMHSFIGIIFNYLIFYLIYAKFVIISLDPTHIICKFKNSIKSL